MIETLALFFALVILFGVLMKKTKFDTGNETGNEYRNRNLEALTDEELLDFARKVTGTSALPLLPTVPYAFRRLAAMVDQYKEDAEFLGKLRAVGVDNWEGYELAQMDFMD